MTRHTTYILVVAILFVLAGAIMLGMDWPSEKVVPPPTPTDTPPEVLDSLSYNSNTLNLTRFAAMTAQMPVVGDIQYYVFTVDPPLPSGLTMEAHTGRISGTPNGSASSDVYTVTATHPVSYGDTLMAGVHSLEDKNYAISTQHRNYAGWLQNQGTHTDKSSPFPGSSAAYRLNVSGQNSPALSFDYGGVVPYAQNNTSYECWMYGNGVVDFYMIGGGANGSVIIRGDMIEVKGVRGITDWAWCRRTSTSGSVQVDIGWGVGFTYPAATAAWRHYGLTVAIVGLSNLANASTTITCFVDGVQTGQIIGQRNLAYSNSIKLTSTPSLRFCEDSDPVYYDDAFMHTTNQRWLWPRASKIRHQNGVRTATTALTINVV